MVGKAEPYKLAPEFERDVLRHLVFEQRFWSRIGDAVEPEAFSGESQRLVALAATAIGRETGKAPGSGSLIVQRVQRWRQEGRVTHEAVLDVDDYVGELEDLDHVGDVDLVVDELVPVVRERRNREGIRLAMKRVGAREDLDDVIDHLKKTARLGVGQQIVGVRLNAESLSLIQTLKGKKRLPTGIMELDLELGGGPRPGTLNVAMGGAGDGKCHRAGQRVYLYDGRLKRVEDIEIGDVLMGPEGFPRNVLATSQGFGRLYEVFPRRGKRWYVNGNHVLTLIRQKHRMSYDIIDVPVLEWLTWSSLRKSFYTLIRATDVIFDRRRGPAFPYGQRNRQRVGFGIIPTDREEPFFGFTLDGDGRYVLDDFTVTHNSMFLCHVAGSSVLEGRDTAVVTLELSEEMWLSRIAANLTGVAIDDIVSGDLLDVAGHRLSTMPGCGACFVGQFAPEATTVQEVLEWVTNLEEREGVRFSTLIVDYADLMGHSRKRDYEGMREVYSGLREEFAVKREGWVWTASQSRRKQKRKEKQGADDAADSQNKIRVADLWIVLGTSEQGDEIEFRVVKHRGGKRGSNVTLPVEFSCARLAPIIEEQNTGETLDLF